MKYLFGVGVQLLFGEAEPPKKDMFFIKYKKVVMKLNYTGEDNLEIMNEAVNYNRQLLALLLKAKVRKNCKIADLGAGNGFFAKSLKRLGYKNIVCIEPAMNMQRYLNEFKLFSLIDDIDDCSLDWVYSLNVLEHIEDDVATIKNIHCKLKKGGKVFVYVPAFQCLFSSMDKKVGHYRRYSKNDIIKKFENNGFVIDDCQYADFLGFFASLIFKVMVNKSGTPNVAIVKIYDNIIFPFSVFLDKITGGKLLGKNLFLIARKK